MSVRKIIDPDGPPPMTTYPRKRLWILGAGFSRPLDGPLLADLFKMETQEEIEADFPQADYGKLASEIRQMKALFNLGLEKKRWPHAEKFLAYVDDAYVGKVEPKRRLLTTLFERAAKFDADKYEGPTTSRVWNKDLVEYLDVIARKALAAECLRFTFGAETSSEAWVPYMEWTKALIPGVDTVLGFNYDHVIEIADSELNRIWARLPSETDRDQHRIEYLKLHGSGDWFLDPEPNGGKKKVARAGSAENLLKMPSNPELAIAPPGGSKSKFCDQYLGRLWLWAEEAIRAADDIFIVGYSMPDTDSRAQHRILRALTENEERVQQQRTIRIVLGPEVNATTRRLMTLLRSTRGQRLMTVQGLSEDGGSSGDLRIIQQELWAQDFLLRFEYYQNLGPLRS
jgi:hypothetical protein